jgi:hypothetical protein
MTQSTALNRLPIPSHGSQLHLDRALLAHSEQWRNLSSWISPQRNVDGEAKSEASGRNCSEERAQLSKRPNCQCDPEH